MIRHHLSRHHLGCSKTWCYIHTVEYQEAVKRKEEALMWKDRSKKSVTDGQIQHHPHPQGFYKIVKAAKKIRARTEGISNTTQSKEGEVTSDLGGKMKRSIMMY